jgi:hypothetical protein
MSDLNRVVHLVATNPAFRAALSADPERALAEHRLQVTADEMSLLSDLDHLLELRSEDLLARLLISAIGPEKIWEAQSNSTSYAGAATG